jgi:hypothetical protein
MLRLVQTSDVHLGARHPFMGERAGEQRERQATAFERTVELALATPADLFLIAGDLFASSVEPRALVERVGAALKKLVQAGVPIVLLPGTGDAPGRASIYHASDLVGLVGEGPGAGSLTILAGDDTDVILPSLGARVTSRFPVSDLPDDGWRIGMIHTETRPRDDEIASAGVDYLAIGGPHAAATGRAANVTWGASGSPELVDVESAEGGEVLLATFDEPGGRPTVERQRLGRTRFERLDLQIAGLADQGALVDALARKADADLVLDARLVGDWPDAIDVDPDAAETDLAGRFLRLRVRNLAVPGLTVGQIPPQDTIAGAFLHDLEARIAEAETTGGDGTAAELREALRLGRRLLSEQGVEP